MFLTVFFTYLQASGDTLWSIFESEGAFFPEDLKLILKATKYDNLFSLQHFTEEDKEKIEIFMQTVLYQLIKEEDREQYYGIFKDHPEKFLLVGGLEQALTVMIELAKNVTSSNRLAKATSFVSSTSRRTQAQCNEDQKTVEEKIMASKTVLESNVNKYLQDNYASLFLPQVSAVVSVDPTGSYIATLHCPVADCEKLTKVSRNKTRWNTSNFYTHVTTHFPEKKRPKTPVTPVQTFVQVKEEPILQTEREQDF